MPMLSVAAQSGVILLREGLEAILVISALAAFLRRAGAGNKVGMLHASAILAILASIAGAFVLEMFLGGAHNDTIEAIVMAVAAALMFYMSGWLFLKQDGRARQRGLRDIADRAISTGTALSLAAIAFLAVFREGAETILFLHALAGTAGGWSTGFWTGLLAAAVALGAVWVAVDAFAARLPLRPLFLVTSAFLFVMGLRFVGAAMQELQELQLIGYHEIAMPDAALGLGVNPTLQALGIQGAIVLLAVAGVLFTRLRLRAGIVPAE